MFMGADGPHRSQSQTLRDLTRPSQVVLFWCLALRGQAVYPQSGEASARVTSCRGFFFDRSGWLSFFELFWNV